MSHAVEDGILRFVSPSQVATFDESEDGGCNRKWYYAKVLRIPDKRSRPGADLGTKIHKEIEHYEETGVDALGAIAGAARHLILPPQPALLVEHKLRNFLIGAIPFVGLIDQVNLGDWYLDEDGNAKPLGNAVEIVDFKTSKDPERYGKSGHALARTVQMVSYGRYALHLLRVPEVRLSHVTMATEGPPRACKTTTLVPAEDLLRRFERVAAAVESMAGVARAAEATHVRANEAACGAYGGCPYRDICPRDPATVAREMLGHRSRFAR